LEGFAVSVDLDQPIIVNTFGFNIPCQEFVISAQITRDKRMPMVDEFVLRALFVVEKIAISKLAKFFTFEGAELAIALADLQSRSLVNIEGEDVSLHASAKELFRAAADKESPTLIAAEEFHANVWFDLVSQSLIVRRGPHHARNLLTLKARSGLDLGTDFARQAFDQNFHEFLRKVRGIKNPEQWNLYAILDVQNGRHSSAQWPAQEVLKWGATPKLERVLVPEDEDRVRGLQHLVAAMADEMRDVSGPNASTAARDEYGRLFGGDSLGATLHSDGYVDLERWLASQNTDELASTQALVGFPYIARNAKSLANLIANGDRGSAGESAQIVWLRPGGSNWGLTEDLNDFLGEVRAALRHRGVTQFSTTLLIPSSVPTRSAKVFDRIFDSGVHLPPSSLSNGLEVLLIPNVAAIVSVTVALAAKVSVPVGTVTTERQLLKRIEERSRLVELCELGETLWHRGRSKKERESSPAAAPST
jgi:hypothetical protein